MPPENNPAPTTPPSTPPSSESPLKQIRTFQGDIANALTQNKESLFSIQQMEKLKTSSGGTVPNNEPDDSGKRKELFLLTLGSLILISLGVVGAWYGYKEYEKKTAPPTIAIPESRILPIQSSVEVDTTGLSRSALVEKLFTAGSGAKAGELREILLRTGSTTLSTLTTSAEFLKQLNSSAPGNLVRSFEPYFMLGTLGESRFIIFRLASFENAFSGMLNWEKNLPADLGTLFSTAPLLSNITTESVFKDVIYRNKDVRLLSVPTGPNSTSTTPVLMYSFFDNKKLIITDNIETLQILIDRLTQTLLVN